jgi:ribonuclease P protein subunit RPR2
MAVNGGRFDRRGKRECAGVDEQQVAAQTLRYAEEFGALFESERAQRLDAERAHAELQRAYRATVASLAAALEVRDDATGGHAERVTALALDFACAVAPKLCDDPELEYAFLLHDVGKIGIADAILLKPGVLDPAERAEIEQHPLLGARIIAGIPFLDGLARDVVLGHHERWDGTGYPQRLVAEEIPLAARLFAFADSFDAMTNARPYRAAMSIGEAFDEIAAGSGGQFDPALVAVFLSIASDAVAA